MASRGPRSTPSTCWDATARARCRRTAVRRPQTPRSLPVRCARTCLCTHLFRVFGLGLVDLSGLGFGRGAPQATAVSRGTSYTELGGKLGVAFGRGGSPSASPPRVRPQSAQWRRSRRDMSRSVSPSPPRARPQQRVRPGSAASRTSTTDLSPEQRRPYTTGREPTCWCAPLPPPALPLFSRSLRASSLLAASMVSVRRAALHPHARSWLLRAS